MYFIAIAMYGRALANSSGSINHLDKGISKMCVWEYFDLLTGYTVILDRLRLLLDQKNPSRRPVTTHTYIYDTRKHLNLEARNILIVRRNHGSNIIVETMGSEGILSWDIPLRASSHLKVHTARIFWDSSLASSSY